MSAFETDIYREEVKAGRLITLLACKDSTASKRTNEWV